MHRFTFTALLFLNLTSFSQPSDSNKLYFGFYFSPNISFATLSNTWESEIKNINEPKFGIALGMSLDYKINKLFSLETGLSISNRGFQTKEINLIDTSYYAPDKLKIIHHFYYLSIPLKCNYYKDFEKISILSSIGVISNIIISNNDVYVKTYGEDIVYDNLDGTDDYRKYVLTASVSLGIAYRLTEGLKITVLPTFQHDILSIIDYESKIYLWDIGLNIGMKCKL